MVHIRSGFAIAWHLCLVAVVRSAAAGASPGGLAIRQGSSVVSNEAETFYSGPRPKKILPLIAVVHGTEQISQPAPAHGIATLPKHSELAKTHADNWSKAASGYVHYAYGGQGPHGSLGVDPDLARRHAERVARDSHDHVDDSASAASVAHAGNGAGVTTHAEVFPRPPRNACLTLTNLRHAKYVIDASIGTPGQAFRPMFDTGSSNTWVVHSGCDSPGCHDSMKFNPGKSRTFHSLPSERSKVMVKFVSGDVVGEMGVDDFTIGGVTVRGQEFAMLRHIPGRSTNAILKSTHFDGMIGLAFPRMLHSPGEPLYERYLQSLGADPVFSFYYSRDGRSSAVMFGGADEHFHVGRVRMIPVVREYYWEVALREVWLGDRRVCCDGPTYAIFDSGTAFNSMPHESFTQLMAAYPFTACEERSAVELLSGMPTIRYVFGNGVEATLRPEQYSFISDGECRPAYMQINVNVFDGPAYVLGSMAFMPHYYTVFQRGSHPMVGIAPADHARAAAFMREQAAH